MYHIYFKIRYNDKTLLEDKNILDLSSTFMNVLLLMMLILYRGGGYKTFIFGPNLIVCYIKEFLARKLPMVTLPRLAEFDESQTF